MNYIILMLLTHHCESAIILIAPGGCFFFVGTFDIQIAHPPLGWKINSWEPENYLKLTTEKSFEPKHLRFGGFKKLIFQGSFLKYETRDLSIIL